MTLRELIKTNKFEVRITLEGKKDGLLYYAGLYNHETNKIEHMFIDPALDKLLDKEDAQ